MKYLILLIVAAGSMLPGSARQILIETESFQDKGGWRVDQQFVDQMGSPYLLAHGMGTPVADAQTTTELRAGGTYYIYVRTYNWTAPFSDEPGAGRFRLKVNDGILPVDLGSVGNGWQWQLAGRKKLRAGALRLALHDLTGFEGRADAILLSTTPLPRLDTSREDMERMRSRLVAGYDEVTDGGSYDFVVVGGGYSGICAAVAAARQGLKVALVQDRAVLGGNNSSEIRVQMGGSVSCEPYPNLGNLLKEFAPTRKGNAMPVEYYGDDRKMDIVRSESNISLFTMTRIVKVEMTGNHIDAVVGRGIENGRLIRFSAPLFSDCTGDGNVGVLAGADYMVGRECRADFGEHSAPLKRDCMVLGASLQWNSEKQDQPVAFPEFNFGCNFTDSSVQQVTKGVWTWETGMMKDQVAEAEQIRDYGMLVIYANWSYLKNHSSYRDKYANLQLGWVSHVSGKRESRRLVGDYVMTETDIVENRIYEDATATSSWTIDLHYPEPENSRYFPGREFKSICVQEEVPLSPIPYRCFYTKKIDNLFMAGRDISVTHIALGSVRVMRTTAMMGEVVGLAASVCHRRHSLPRSVYTHYFSDLRSLMEQGAGRHGIPNNQLTNVGRNCHHFFTPQYTLHSSGAKTQVVQGIPFSDISVEGISFRMVKVEGGSFDMGCADGFAADRPVHGVTVDDYYIGQTEVTQELWTAVMGKKANTAGNRKGGKYPIERILPAAIEEFLHRLSERTGRTFRLPTEAEWEYAARGGRYSRGYRYSGSDSVADVAWNVFSSGGNTHEVAQLQPNELGLYDMSGNVFEWCSDWYGKYPASPQVNPKGPSQGAYRCLRGGCWLGENNSCRTTYRSYDATESMLFNNGFRLVMEP